MKAFLRALLLGSLLFSFSVEADPTRETEYFLKEFRCVTCPNQNINDSSAPIAKAMREEITRRLEQGESQEAVRDFLLSHYGDYVTYKPLLKNETAVLWFGPCIMILAGLFSWVYFMRKKKAA